MIIESGAGDSAQFPDSTYEAVGTYGLERKIFLKNFLYFVFRFVLLCSVFISFYLTFVNLVAVRFNCFMMYIFIYFVRFDMARYDVMQIK